MFKRIVAFVVCSFVLVCSLNAFAAVPYREEFAVNLVKELEIMVGDSYGNMNLSSKLTRAEFAKLAICASEYKNSVAHGAKISVFKDCTYKHWSAPYVKVAVTNKIINGYPDGTFKPDKRVSFEEAVVVLLYILGYTDADFGNTWPYGQVNLASNIGLTANVSRNIGEEVTRKDALKLVYNMLNTKSKGSDKEYASKLNVTLYENVVLMATNKEDTSVPYGSVLTGQGTFKCSEFTIEPDYIGKKGDLAVKSDGEILCFVPNSQFTDRYIVYSNLSNAIIVYEDGKYSELALSDNTTVYRNAEKTSFASVKSQLCIGDVLYVVKNGMGAVEYLTLDQDNLIGPRTVSGDVLSLTKEFTNDVSGLKYVRNGEMVSSDKIVRNDIVYYSEELNMLFAYSTAVTGVYEKAIPNKEAPKSVMISGTQYDIESVTAFDKLSVNGTYDYDASVTLLMGKDGKIADVISPNSTTHVVYSVLADSVIVYDNGTLKKLEMENDTIVYSDSSKLSYASAKSQMSIGDIIEVYTDANGDTEYITLTKDSLKGPETLYSYTSAWYKNFTDDLAGLTVIRNGEKVSADALKANDVIYYLDMTNTAFVYANTVSGIYEKAIPNKDTPTSVVVSGVEYDLETITAFDKLSSNGNISIGSSVTLLLGKDMKVADVVTMDNSGDSLVGFLIETGKKNFENANGQTFNSNYIKVILSDGTIGEYTTSSSYSSYSAIINSPVSISFVNGNAKVTKLREQSVASGVVDAKAMTIGSFCVADDVQIIDVSTTRSDYGSTVTKTYMPRLDGVNLSYSSILYYEFDDKREINKLILNDVTGDGDLFGLVTSAPGNKDTSTKYTIDVNGKSYQYSKGRHSAISTMSPVGIKVSGSGTAESIYALSNAGNVEGIGNTYVEISGEQHILSDKVTLYIKKGIGNYISAPISDLPMIFEQYKISAYRDGKESTGGRIRILLAQ